MSSLGDGSGSGEGSAEVTVEVNKPLWNYVAKLGRSFEGGGNVAFKCNYCHTTYKESYFRVKAHLLKINGHGIRVFPKVNSSQVNEMQKQVDEAEMRIKRGLPKEIPLPSTHASCHSTSSIKLIDFSATGGSSRQQGYEPKKREGVGDNLLEKEFNIQVREQLDDEIARMFFSVGLPFNLAKNPHYKITFTFACNNNLASYIPPGYHAIRSKLLERERS